MNGLNINSIKYHFSKVSYAKGQGRQNDQTEGEGGNLSYRGNFRGCFHDPALLGCNQAWDRFDILKIGKNCSKCLSKIVS